MITTQEALNRLIDNNELFFDEMVHLMRLILNGEVSPEITAALLIGLRIKVESVSEVAAAATVIREFATEVPIQDRTNLLDIVGTGGDNAHTFNISTCTMFVAAAAGAKVAKHGNRAVSSSSGSADALESMGINLKLSPEQVGQCIDQLGLGFMYAPNHHQAMRHVAPVRKALGVRTIFNILGPLLNPAQAPNQLMGVFHPDLVGIQSRVVQQLGAKHVMVVNGCDGLDEITLLGPTKVAELKEGWIREYAIHPHDFGIDLIDTHKPIQAHSTAESLQKIDSVLAGELGPCRDIVLLNAAAALYCANIATDLHDGFERAKVAIDSGEAKRKQQSLISHTQQLQTTEE